MRVSGRVAMVTGSGRGLGRATVEALANGGAAVAVVDIDADAVAGTVATLDAGGHRAVGAVADVTDEGAMREAVGATEAALGPIDILVNNAGGAPAGVAFRELTAMTMADVSAFLALNLGSAFLCTGLMLPGMVARGWGRVLCVSSISAVFGQRGGSAYAAAKAGLEGFVASVSKEVAGSGVTVNAVMYGNAPHPSRTADRQAVLDAWSHVGRVGDPAEFAAAARFLVSEDASYITGAILPVDGGTLRFGLL